MSESEVKSSGKSLRVDRRHVNRASVLGLPVDMLIVLAPTLIPLTVGLALTLLLPVMQFFRALLR